MAAKHDINLLSVGNIVERDLVHVRPLSLSSDHCMAGVSLAMLSNTCAWTGVVNDLSRLVTFSSTRRDLLWISMPPVPQS